MIDAATLGGYIKNDIERSTTTLTRLLLLRSIITIIVLAHAIALAHALAHALALARARDRDRAHALARDLDLDRDRDRDLDRIRARFVGSALTHTLTRALYRNTSTSNWSAEFAHEFTDVTGIAKAGYVVSPDTLADRTQNGRQDLVNLLGPLDGAASLPWAHQVAINLRETALPIFTRQQPLTADTATVIRLTALCLAAEADARKADQLGDTFREIAAGVTLLERRATGQAVPTETIMLAVT